MFCEKSKNKSKNYDNGLEICHYKSSIEHDCVYVLGMQWIKDAQYVINDE